MIEYKYGEFSSEQLEEYKKLLRKKIFFLLLIKDPNPDLELEERLRDVNPEEAFDNLQRLINGMNSLFDYPAEIITICNLIEAARLEMYEEPFKFGVYRKLVLDAGSEVLKIGGM